MPDEPATHSVTGRRPGAEPGHWGLWQLMDSAFPTGGFAHSAGLEAAWQHGQVRSREELISYLDSSLQQAGSAALPFVTAAHDAPDRLDEFDAMCDAFTTNHVANRASRAQGRAFLSAVTRVYHLQAAPAPIRLAHWAPVFGATLAQLVVARETSGRMFLFQHLRGVLAAAVRLNIVGPMEAQAIQHRFAPRAESLLQAGLAWTLDDLAQTAPLLDLWQGGQDRLYSRLFQS